MKLLKDINKDILDRAAECTGHRWTDIVAMRLDACRPMTAETCSSSRIAGAQQALANLRLWGYES